MEVCVQCLCLGDGWNIIYNNCVANLVPVLNWEAIFMQWCTIVRCERPLEMSFHPISRVSGYVLTIPLPWICSRWDPSSEEFSEGSLKLKTEDSEPQTDNSDISQTLNSDVWNSFTCFIIMSVAIFNSRCHMKPSFIDQVWIVAVVSVCCDTWRPLHDQCNAHCFLSLQPDLLVSFTHFS